MNLNDRLINRLNTSIRQDTRLPINIANSMNPIILHCPMCGTL